MRKIILLFIYVLSVALFLIACGEMFLRFTEHESENEGSRVVISTPSPFFIADQKLGYAMHSGEFHVSQNDNVKWISTHDKDGHRITSSETRTDTASLWIFGCSFTYGWGLNDQDTYSYLLQKRFPNMGVKNFAIGGHGTLQTLIQLEDELKKTAPPKTIIVAYGDFHDIRNVGSPLHLKAFNRIKQMSAFRYPYAHFTNNMLSVSYAKLDYSGIPFSNKLRILKFIEDQYDQYIDKSLDRQNITRILLLKIATICKENDIRFLLAGINRTDKTKEMLRLVSSKDIVTFDMSVDLSSAEFIVKFDGHPNEKAHRHYADVISEHIVW